MAFKRLAAFSGSGRFGPDDLVLLSVIDVIVKKARARQSIKQG